jgi:hypothetical protein
MSAHGYKQTFQGVSQNVRFTPESRHSAAQERFGLKKRKSDVRLAPNSGHKWLGRGMSAFDPKRTLRVMLDVGESKRQPRHELVRFAAVW